MNLRKAFTILGIMMVFPLMASAADIMPEKVLAVAQDKITNETINTQQVVTVYALEDYSLLDNTMEIKKGDRLVLILNSYNNPTRGKRNGTYSITLKSPLPKGTGAMLSGSMAVATTKDMKGIAKSVGISVVGKVLQVPGFSQAVAAAKGVIKPDEEVGRLKSVEKNVYESTPLKYAEKGKNFVVEPDGVVVLKLRSSL